MYNNVYKYFDDENTLKLLFEQKKKRSTKNVSSIFMIFIINPLFVGMLEYTNTEREVVYLQQEFIVIDCEIINVRVFFEGS